MQATAFTSAGLPHLTLDDLAAESYDALGARYATGLVPPNRIEALDGALTGRMLAFRGLGRPPLALLQQALTRFAAAPSFPWEGKSFQSEGPEHGTGVNRVSMPRVLGRQNLFPFTTHVGPSLIDGQPAVILDYDLPENPPYIRRIHDEVRLVGAGLFLGPAMWKATAGGAATILWFAVDAGPR